MNTGADSDDEGSGGSDGSDGNGNSSSSSSCSVVTIGFIDPKDIESTDLYITSFIGSTTKIFTKND